MLLRLAQLLDLDVGQLHLLLRVYHLSLELRESLRGEESKHKERLGRPGRGLRQGKGPAGQRCLMRAARGGQGALGRAPPGRPLPSSAPGPRAPPSSTRPAPARGKEGGRGDGRGRGGERRGMEESRER